MIPNSLLGALLVLGVGGDRQERLTQISQRLDAGDPAAIDELLASTSPAASGEAPSEAEIERLRQEVLRLRALSPAGATPAEPIHPAKVDVETSLREARAWLRAGDPSRCLEALSSVPATGEAAFWRACALEQLRRDAEALEQYRAAADAASPVLKAAAASGADHVEWRSRRAVDPEAKP
ncbi:MAG: hypothetical protein ACKVXR_07685 [Planctomycetota bacterium]